MNWNDISRIAQNEVIVKLFNAIVAAGLCSTKGRKPIADIQLVIERKFNTTFNTVDFADRVRALLNKGDDRLNQRIERQSAMLKLLAEFTV
jgi:hypothetical protein